MKILKLTLMLLALTTSGLVAQESSTVKIVDKYEVSELCDADYAGCTTKRYVFKECPARDLVMEVDLPLDQDGNAPFIIYVHGGSWKGGNASSFQYHSKYMASRGIAGVRITYTLVKDGGNFEMGMREMEMAYKFVKRHAKEWHLDMKRVGFAGGSAGTPLSSLMAIKHHAQLYIGYNGMYNMVRVAEDGGFPKPDNTYVSIYNDEQKAKFSAINFVSTKNPPAVALFHGNEDTTISYMQSVHFAEAIEKSGGEATAYIYSGHKHAFFNRGKTDAYSDILLLSYEFARRVFEVSE